MSDDASEHRTRDKTQCSNDESSPEISLENNEDEVSIPLQGAVEIGETEETLQDAAGIEEQFKEMRTGGCSKTLTFREVPSASRSSPTGVTSLPRLTYREVPSAVGRCPLQDEVTDDIDEQLRKCRDRTSQMLRAFEKRVRKELENQKLLHAESNDSDSSEIQPSTDNPKFPAAVLAA